MNDAITIGAAQPRSDSAIASAIVVLLLLVAPAGPSSGQNLTLFPNSAQIVLDNGFGDTNLAPNIIHVNNWPIPRVDGTPHPFLQMTGDVIYNFTGPTASVGATASVTITNAFLTNTSPTRQLVGSTPFNAFDYVNMLEVVFADYPAVSGAGSVSTSISGNLGELVGNNLTNGADIVNPATLDQQLHLGTSATTFTGTGSSDFAYAQAFRPGGALPTPVPISSSGTRAGTYAGGPGTLQIHIDDALTLGGNDTIELPSSIDVEVVGPPIAILTGDATNDGAVTADDLIAVQQFFGTAGPNGDGSDLGDANDDGVVTADDLVAVQQNFGMTLAGGAVPEPATAALLGLAAVTVARRGRKPRGTDL